MREMATVMLLMTVKIIIMTWESRWCAATSPDKPGEVTSVRGWGLTQERSNEEAMRGEEMHTYTYTRTCAQWTHTHTMHSTHAHRVLTHAHSALTHMHTVHLHTYHKVQAYMHTHVYKYKYTSTQCIHTHAHKYKHTLICMHMHTMHSHTCTQVQTHIDRHSQRGK